MKEQFLFEETKKIYGMSFSKLPEEWRLYELYCQYHFEKTCREGKAGKVRERIVNVLEKFQTDPVKYAHPLSMLLTLAFFSNRDYQE